MLVRCRVRVGGRDRVHEVGEVIEMLDPVAASHIAAGNVEAVVPELPAAPAAVVDPVDERPQVTVPAAAEAAPVAHPERPRRRRG